MFNRFFECNDGNFLKKVFIDCSLIFFVFVVIGSGDRVGGFMVNGDSLVFCYYKRFGSYSSASSSVTMCSKDVWDVWDCWVVEFVEI